MEAVLPPADHPPEEWRSIVGYEGRYDVSSHGRVRSWLLRTGSRVTIRDEPVIMAQWKSGLKHQYRSISLRRPGETKGRFVHQLVLEAFIGPRPMNEESAHDDGIGHHNWIKNLLWKTKKDNHADKRRHGTSQSGELCPAHKLTRTQVLEIRRDAGCALLKELAARYGVSITAIHNVVTNKTWRHI